MGSPGAVLHQWFRFRKRLLRLAVRAEWVAGRGSTGVGPRERTRQEEVALERRVAPLERTTDEGSEPPHRYQYQGAAAVGDRLPKLRDKTGGRFAPGMRATRRLGSGPPDGTHRSLRVVPFGL